MDGEPRTEAGRALDFQLRDIERALHGMGVVLGIGWDDLRQKVLAIEAEASAESPPSQNAGESGALSDGLTATAMSPWSEAECTQRCGWTPSPAESAQDHVRLSGHETAIITHSSIHYRKVPDASTD